MTRDSRPTAADSAAPNWESALAEVAQRIPALASDAHRNPMVATVAMFMRHLCRSDPGVPAEGSVEDYGWMAPLAGGIETGLRRLAASEDGDPHRFLREETELALLTRHNFAVTFRDAMGPLVRAATKWGERPLPNPSAGQVALFTKYLAKDPDVVPALMATIAFGLPRLGSIKPDARSGSRPLDRANRALQDYFARRGSRTYCELVRETATACEGPGYGLVTVQLLKVALTTLRVALQSSKMKVAKVMDAMRAEAREKEGKAEEIRSVRRERDRAVAAARKEGIATSAERVRALEARVRALEGQLDTIRRREAREKAHQERRANAEGGARTAPGTGTTAAAAKHVGGPKAQPLPAAGPPAVIPEPVAAQRPLLEGRRVFLFTNKRRGAAREAFRAELVALGASGPRVYETKGATVPGPKTFPPGSVVIVDTSFMSHSFSGVISRRARAGEGTVLVEDRIGIGGLAQRVAAAMRRQVVRASGEASPPLAF